MIAVNQATIVPRMEVTTNLDAKLLFQSGHGYSAKMPSAKC
jgi:hypothetical protein